MNRTLEIHGMPLGGEAPLLFIAGPCVLEDESEALYIAETLLKACQDVGSNLVFKGSFDKANRTSVHSKRGLGMTEGLRILAEVKEQFNIPVTTDIHDASHAQPASEVVDILQIPAFLCRQTDLLVAAANTNSVVNVKKGQFLSPNEMKHIVAKLEHSSCDKIMLTERGTFFGYNMLVNDFIGLGDMMEIGPPICFDVTHSTQLPGGGSSTTAGRPDRALLLAKAATAAGVDALFLECHPNPASAASDSSTMQPLSKMHDIISVCTAIRQSIRNVHSNESL